MSIQILYQADILIDGTAASTEFSKIKLTLNQPAKERTAFQDVARCYLPGIYDASAEGEFYYQTGGQLVASHIEPLIKGPTPGAFVPIVLTLGADLLPGNIVNIWRGVAAKMPMGAQHGEVLKGTLDTEAADRSVQATRLYRSTIAATSGIGTGFNLGAVAAGQSLYAALHVIGTTNTALGTTFQVAVSSSSGFTVTVPATLFATGTTAVAGEWATVVGPIVGPWYALKWQGFPGTVATVSLSAGIQ